MKKVYVSDNTLNQEKQNTLSFKENLEIIRHLDKLGTDVIELCQLQDVNKDALLLKTVASILTSSTLSLKIGMDSDIDLCYQVISKAKSPRLSLALPVSTVMMEYKHHMKASGMLEAIEERILKCANLSMKTEFVALDATRAEHDFLVSAISCAIDAGANVITIADSAAVLMPYEVEEFIFKLYNDIPKLKNVRLGVNFSDRLNLAAACSMQAVCAGASEVKVCAGNGENTPYSQFAEIIRERERIDGYKSSVKYTELSRTISQIEWISDSKRSSMAVFDSDSENQLGNGELLLTENDDINTVIRAIKNLGYDLSDEDNNSVFETVKKTAEKKAVGTKELDAIIASTALQAAPTYRLLSYLVNSGNVISPSAYIKLQKNDSVLEGICIGDGPIDAAFLAIEQITGHHYELDDFQIQSVTEGREALGSATIKLRNGSKLYAGRGISTDIIAACIHAYLNAVNKIAHEEDGI